VGDKCNNQSAIITSRNNDSSNVPADSDKGSAAGNGKATSPLATDLFFLTPYPFLVKVSGAQIRLADLS
jgi:hypothetical protein